MIFRTATNADIDAIAEIYADTHTLEEQGVTSIGWVRSIYPTKATALQSLEKGDLFVCEKDGTIVGSAIINQIQVAEYYGAPWHYPADDSEVMVLHTLVISPKAAGMGLGKAFVGFYEQYAKQNGCKYLRMDTNVKNARARAMYNKLGFSEIGTAPCNFNGIEGVTLILLEKRVV